MRASIIDFSISRLTKSKLLNKFYSLISVFQNQKVFRSSLILAKIRAFSRKMVSAMVATTTRQMCTGWGTRQRSSLPPETTSGRRKKKPLKNSFQTLKRNLDRLAISLTSLNFCLCLLNLLPGKIFNFFFIINIHFCYQKMMATQRTQPKHSRRPAMGGGVRAVLNRTRPNQLARVGSNGSRNNATKCNGVTICVVSEAMGSFL